MADINGILKQTKAALTQALSEKKRSQEFVNQLGPAVVQALEPLLQEIAQNSKTSKEELIKALSSIKIDVPKSDIPKAQVDVQIPEIKVPQPIVNVTVPDIKVPEIPEIKIPKISVPKPEVTVNVPEIKIPDLKWPKDELDVKGWVGFQGYDKGLLSNPLPVQLRDASGKPVNLLENLTTVIGGGGGGGKHDYFTVKGIQNSIAAVLLNPDGNPANISATITGGGSSVSLVNADGTYYNSDNPLPVTFSAASIQPVSQVSGHSWSVFASLDTTVALYNGDNRLRVSVETGGSGLTDAELRASSVPVEQVSGSVWSTAVTNAFSAVADTGGGEGVDKALRVVQASGAVSSVSVTNTPTVLLSGSLTSAVVTGPTLHDAADDGDAPVKTGGVAIQTVPTAVADGDRVRFIADDLGRQLVRYQARDLTQSAYISLTNGTETTLVTGVASTYLDLVWIVGANNSDAAVSVDLRSGTAGSVLLTLEIPAYGTAGANFGPDPLQQEIVAGAWTADMPDITGTTISLSAKFNKEK